MNAGTLTRRITIQQNGSSVDALGQPVEGWTTYKTVWADIRHLSGLESIKGGMDTAVIKASIRIRYTTGITEAMRVIQGSTVYQIKAVLEHGREWLDLVCEVVK